MHVSQSSGREMETLGFSDRGDIIQGTGYMGDGRSEKRNGRGDDPGVSNSSTA